jgi:hypothetical protein
MINENTIYYIDDLTNEKKIYYGDRNALQIEAKKQLEQRNIKIIKKDNYLLVYQD